MHRKWMRVSLGVLLFTGALEAQQTASSGIVGQVVDTTQAAIAGAARTSAAATQFTRILIVGILTR